MFFFCYSLEKMSIISATEESPLLSPKEVTSSLWALKTKLQAKCCSNWWMIEKKIIPDFSYSDKIAFLARIYCLSILISLNSIVLR